MGDVGFGGHRCGLVAVDRSLMIGVVQIVARTSGLQVELIARSLLDRRSADQRRAAIGVLTAATLPAVRYLCPAAPNGQLRKPVPSGLAQRVMRTSVSCLCKISNRSTRRVR